MHRIKFWDRLKKLTILDLERRYLFNEVKWYNKSVVINTTLKNVSIYIKIVKMMFLVII